MLAVKSPYEECGRKDWETPPWAPRPTKIATNTGARAVPSPSKVLSTSTALSTAPGWKSSREGVERRDDQPKPTPRNTVATSRRPKASPCVTVQKLAGDEQGHRDQIGDEPGEVHPLEAEALGEGPSQQRR